MTHVHYKFSSKRSYNTVVFDGVNITICELKRLIMTREKLRAADCDLQIMNAQTKEEYTDDCQIPKGSSVIVRRVPSRGGKSHSSANSSERSEAFNYSSGFFKPPKDGKKSTGVFPFFSQMADLASAEVSEDDKIKTIMNQSCYDSSTYQKYGAPLPPNYTCYRCGSSEHHIRNCPVNLDKNAETPVRIKKSTGIPRSFMVKVDDPTIKGAMLTNTGDYAVPAIDAQVYAVGKKKIPIQEQRVDNPSDTPIPDELQCLICRDLLNDAVVIPCCGNSYCDDCIRSALLDSEDHVCPTCNLSDVSPDTLIANKFLRQAVNNFTRERSCNQSLKSALNTSRSQDCTPRASPAPTPPPQSQPEKVEDPCTIITSDSPPSSSNTSLAVVKVLDETTESEADLKTNSSPVESPSILVSDADTSDSKSKPIPLLNLVTHTAADVTASGSTSVCDQAPHWDRSTLASLSEGWTPISAHPPASSSSTLLLPQSPNITSLHLQTYLQQQPLSSYPPCFSTTTPSWTSGPSPQGAPIPAYTSSPSPTVPPLLPKDLMLFHRRNQERTPPRGSSYYTSCGFSSKSHRSKSSRSNSRSPSRSHDRKRHHSPYSSHRGASSRAHSSHSYSHSYKRSRSSTTTSSPSSHSQHRSRSPVDRHKSHHHGHHHSSSKSSRRRREKEASEWSYDTYQRWKQEYTDWCEKYFNSYFSHFHQMPPPPLMPPPQPHWPSPSSYYPRGRSPPSTDSRSSNSQSYSDRSSTTTHSSSSYSDTTPTQSFSDCNSPQSDDCSRASHKSGKVDENQSKVREGGKQKSKSSSRPKSPPKKIEKHKDKKAKDLKRSHKEKERKCLEEKEEKRHKVKASEKTSCTDADRSRQPGHSRSPDLRSDKSRKGREEETLRNQRQNILIESSSSADTLPKVLERPKEKPKKVFWKPQPLTKENAWEDGVKVKLQKKININISLDSIKNEKGKHDIEEDNKTIEAESHTKGNEFYDHINANQLEEPLAVNEGIKDFKNDSWEIFPDDETTAGEDSDLWQCALTAVEGEDVQERSVGMAKTDMKPQDQEDIWNSKKTHEIPSTIIENSCFKMEQSGSVMICEQLQTSVVKAPVENTEKRSLEKHTDLIKIPCSRREMDGSEREEQAKVSSHLREVKGKVKRRLVEVEISEGIEDSARLDGTVAPSCGGEVNDNSFDFGRKKKKKAEHESRKGEESRRHKERESYSTLVRKSANGSSQAFSSALDAEKYTNHRESDEGPSREAKSHKIKMELNKQWKGKDYFTTHYYNDGQQDPKVHLSRSTSHSHSDSKDRGQLPSKTSQEGSHHGQSWTCTNQRLATPTAESSQGTAFDLEKMRERRGEREEDSKNECKNKQKSHKKETRHACPDEVR